MAWGFCSACGTRVSNILPGDENPLCAECKKARQQPQGESSLPRDGRLKATTGKCPQCGETDYSPHEIRDGKQRVICKTCKRHYTIDVVEYQSTHVNQSGSHWKQKRAATLTDGVCPSCQGTDWRAHGNDALGNIRCECFSCGTTFRSTPGSQSTHVDQRSKVTDGTCPNCGGTKAQRKGTRGDNQRWKCSCGANFSTPLGVDLFSSDDSASDNTDDESSGSSSGSKDPDAYKAAHEAWQKSTEGMWSFFKPKPPNPEDY